jgi:outer membrane receptor for ferrienterochelin and colicins
MVLGGVRVDKSNQIPKWILSPRGGVRVSIKQDLTWRFSVSTGFRAPGVFDEDLHIASAGGDALLIENGPNLKEERSLSFSTGLDYIGLLQGRRYSLGANFFSTTLRDNFLLVESEPEGPDSRLWLRTNGPGSYVRGVDINGDYEITRDFSIRGGATFQVARFDQPEPQFGSLDFFRTPDRYGFLGFDWHLPGEIEFLGTADFTGAMKVPHLAGYIPEDRLENSSCFAVLTFVVSRTFDVTDQARMRLYLNAGNVTDNFQPDLDRGPNRDSAYVYGPGAMRQFIVGATWEF